MRKLEANLYCPFQNQETTQELKHIHHMKSAGDWSETRGEPIVRDINYYIGRCKEKDHLILYSTETVSEVKSSMADRFELVWPEPSTLPNSVPDEVRECHIQATKAKNSNPIIFGFQIRRGLEAICNDCGISRNKEKRNGKKRIVPLHERISDLVTQRGLPLTIKEMMDALKDLGNAAVHDHLNPILVPDIDLFFRAVVNYVYVWPDRLKEILKNIEDLQGSQEGNDVKVVPLFNPEHDFKTYGDQAMLSFKRVGESGIYVNGAECKRLETRMAEFCRVPYTIAVSSGTMALELLLRGDGIGKDVKVVTTAHTFVAVLEAILAVDAEPVFVDIDPETWQMPRGEWPNDVVMVSHLYGGFSAGVLSIARLLYEDASQSFGGIFEGTPLGTLGRAGAISLHPTKNLSAMGDAGVIITRDARLASRLRALRNHGQTLPQIHDYCGTTGRMDELQAAILSEKLSRFDSFLQARRSAAGFYTSHLNDLPLRFPSEIKDHIPAPNLFVVRSEARNELQNFLRTRGIITGVHYPTPLHKMPAYRDQPWAQVSLPHTELLCDEILSLPLWFGITEKDQEQVVDAIREWCRAGT